jgi:hypothetical protein
VRQPLDRIGQGRDQRVTYVLARQISGDCDAVGHDRGQILGRVDRGVDRAGEERGVDFLGEKALAADVGEWPILNPIARRPNDLKRDSFDLAATRRGQQAAGLVRLGQRQRRTARAKREQGGCSHRSDLSFEKGPVKLSHFRKSALRKGRSSDRRLFALEWPEALLNMSLRCCRLCNSMPFVTGYEELDPRVYCGSGGLSRLGGARRISAGPVRAFARGSRTKRSSRFSRIVPGRRQSP